MAGKGGGAWKVAYADFVTAMMAFFMVMWLIAQKDAVKQAVANSFRNPNSLYAPGDSLLAPQGPQYFKDRRPTVEENPSPPSLDAMSKPARRPFSLAINNGSRTSIGTVIVFSGQSVELTAEARQQLSEMLPLVVGKPQKIEIRGHGDDRNSTDPKQSVDGWQISFSRCLAIKDYLLKQGIPANRLRLSLAGSTEPYSGGNDNPLTGPHSRAEVFMLSEVAADAKGTFEESEKKFSVPKHH